MRQDCSHQKDEQLVYADAQTGPANDVGVVEPELSELGIATGSAFVYDRGADLIAIRVAAAGAGHGTVRRRVVHIVGIAATVERHFQGTHRIVICRGIIRPDRVYQAAHVVQEFRSINSHPAGEHQLQHEQYEHHGGVLKKYVI